MIRLYWYRNNFGDELSPYIIEKLSGERVFYRKPFSIRNYLLDGLRFIKKLIFKRKVDISLLMYSPFYKVIISIGSILEESTANTIVWGAGLGSRQINVQGGDFLAVRGPISQQRLAELKLYVPSAIGDPAILLPIIYPKKSHPLGTISKVGIIPHISDYNDIYERVKRVKNNDICLINLSNTNIEKTIDDIASCDCILSSSLHGLIVSHAYNIRAVHFRKNKLSGDGIKFIDYYYSVNIPNYSPIDFLDIDFGDSNKIRTLIEKLEPCSLPKIDLWKMQKSLIEAAPFNVLDIYKSKRDIS